MNNILEKLRPVVDKTILKILDLLFELKIGLSKDNSIVLDYGGKPVGNN